MVDLTLRGRADYRPDSGYNFRVIPADRLPGLRRSMPPAALHCLRPLPARLQLPLCGQVTSPTFIPLWDRPPPIPRRLRHFGAGLCGVLGRATGQTSFLDNIYGFEVCPAALVFLWGHSTPAPNPRPSLGAGGFPTLCLPVRGQPPPAFPIVPALSGRVHITAHAACVATVKGTLHKIFFCFRLSFRDEKYFAPPLRSRSTPLTAATAPVLPEERRRCR